MPLPGLWISTSKVIASMCQSGMDMGNKYKETSQGALAINVAIIEY